MLFDMRSGPSGTRGRRKYWKQQVRVVIQDGLVKRIEARVDAAVIVDIVVAAQQRDGPSCGVPNVLALLANVPTLHDRLDEH